MILTIFHASCCPISSTKCELCGDLLDRYISTTLKKMHVQSVPKTNSFICSCVWQSGAVANFYNWQILFRILHFSDSTTSPAVLPIGGCPSPIPTPTHKVQGCLFSKKFPGYSNFSKMHLIQYSIFSKILLFEFSSFALKMSLLWGTKQY